MKLYNALPEDKN